MKKETGVAGLYTYRDYRRFLHDAIEESPNGGRGVRAQLARALRCQVPFITHVLAGRNDFSQEQAESAARFFGLSQDGVEFFILLVSFNRAGTAELKQCFRKMLDERAEKHQLLKSKLKIDNTLTPQDQMRYYSSWIFSAIHMATSIPELRSREALATRLRIPRAGLNEALEFLINKGLVSEKKGVLDALQPLLHLERSSSSLLNHHANWRHRAIESLPYEKVNDLHYSGVVTLSRADLERVRECLANALSESIEVIKPSKEEAICGLCLDFFEI